MTVFKDFKFLFFQNQGTRQTITKNIFWLGLAEGITRFLKLALIIYIAKILGATEYGKFTFALSFATLFTVIADFGLAQIIIREFSKEKEKEKDFSALFSLAAILSIISFFLIFAGSFLITSDFLIRKLILIMGIFALTEVFMSLFFAFLQARQKMEYQALIKIFEALLVAGIGFYVLFNSPSLINLSFSYLFASIAATFIILFFFRYKFYPLKISLRWEIWKKYLWISWPLALNSLFLVIYNYTDSIIMGGLGQIIQTGWYNAAQRIIGVILVPVCLINVVFFPVLNKIFIESKKRMYEIWNYYFRLIFFLAVPIIFGGICLAQKIIYLIYDHSFTPAIFAFQILIFTAILNMIIFPFSQLLIVFNQQKKFFWANFIGMVINIFLNFILIPKYSLYGAAVATVISLFFVFIVLFGLAKSIVSEKLVNSKSFFFLLKSFISGVIMYFIISLPVIYSFNVFLSIIIGAASYVMIFLILTAIGFRFKLHK